MVISTPSSMTAVTTTMTASSSTSDQQQRAAKITTVVCGCACIARTGGNKNNRCGYNDR